MKTILILCSIIASSQLAAQSNDRPCGPCSGVAKVEKWKHDDSAYSWQYVKITNLCSSKKDVKIKFYKNGKWQSKGWTLQASGKENDSYEFRIITGKPGDSKLFPYKYSLYDENCKFNDRKYQDGQ